MHCSVQCTSIELLGTGEIVVESICTSRPTKKYMKGVVIGSDCCKAVLQNVRPITAFIVFNDQLLQTGGAVFTPDSLCFRSLDAMPCLGDSGAGLSCKK